MLTPIIFVIPSTIILILLIIVFYSKKPEKSIRNIMFRSFCIAGVYTGITDLLDFFIITKLGDSIITTIVYYFHWITGFVVCYIYYLYIKAFIYDGEKLTFKTFFKEKTSKTLLIINLLTAVLFFFSPFKFYNPDGSISFVPGFPAYFSVGCGLLNYLLSYITSVIKLKQIGKNFLINTTLFMFSSIILIVIQVILPDICFFPLIISILAFSIYEVYENPDLAIINNLKYISLDIEKSKNAKVNFITNMSEEMKTPSNTIINLSNKLLNEDLSNYVEAKNDLEKICDTGIRLLESVNNILDISKIESGIEKRIEEEYSFDMVLKEVNNQMLPKAKSKGLEYIVELGDNIPNKLSGDANKLTQIIINIISNSIKYTSVGKITLKIDSEINKNIVILHFSIADTGIGIKEEDKDKVFDAKDKDQSNNGIGNVVAKRYIELLNGKIWYESVPLVGTTFYFDIPQKIIDFDILSSDYDANSDGDNYDCSGKRLLLIEDNNLNVKIIKNLLEKYNLNIDNYSTGEEAIKSIKKGAKYDLIFVDIMMPDIDGVEILKILKSLKQHFEIPAIIAVTANAITGMKELYLNEGFNDYISKPINIGELNRVVRKYIKKNKTDNSYSVSEIPGTESNKAVDESGTITTSANMVEINVDGDIELPTTTIEEPELKPEEVPETDDELNETITISISEDME